MENVSTAKKEQMRFIKFYLKHLEESGELKPETKTTLSKMIEIIALTK